MASLHQKVTPYLDFVTIGKGVLDNLTLWPSPSLRPLLFLLSEIRSYVGCLFLDQANYLLLGTSVKDVATFAEQELHVFRDVPSSHVDSADAAWHREAFVDWYCMRNSIACIEDNPCCAARSIERENGLDGVVECWYIEGLEENLGCRLSVRSGV